MLDQRKIYVLDTNILVDYPDIVLSMDGSRPKPRNPTIDLDGTHIVIPSAVIRELSSFKKEVSDRGKTARELLRHLRGLAEAQVYSMDMAYHLESPIFLPDGRILSILPVHDDFDMNLPFRPETNDMDGQIILATLVTMNIACGREIDGTDKPVNSTSDRVTLLTNDNGLAIRARERGIKTMRYGYRYPDPYTGRRNLVVPMEIFNSFFSRGYLEREVWEAAMPDEPKLVANEFIVMSLANENQYPNGFEGPSGRPYFENIGRYDAERDVISRLRFTSSFPVGIMNPGQAIYAEALMDPSIAAVICTGPAGSGKTYMATVYGYEACKSGQFIGVTAVPCESRSQIGALPGNLDEKMDPDVQPLKNALRNYLLKEDTKLRKELANFEKFGASSKAPNTGAPEDEPRGSLKQKLKDRVDLIWSNWFSSVPIENARGRDFAHELAIYDEFQDQSISQADTLIKRIGADGKIILTGDIYQIHAPYLDENNNGLVYASHILYNSPLVAQVCFTDAEVVRHPLVAMVAERQKTHK